MLSSSPNSNGSKLQDCSTPFRSAFTLAIRRQSALASVTVTLAPREASTTAATPTPAPSSKQRLPARCGASGPQRKRQRAGQAGQTFRPEGLVRSAVLSVQPRKAVLCWRSQYSLEPKQYLQSSICDGTSPMPPASDGRGGTAAGVGAAGAAWRAASRSREAKRSRASSPKQTMSSAPSLATPSPTAVPAMMRSPVWASSWMLAACHALQTEADLSSAFQPAHAKTRGKRGSGPRLGVAPLLLTPGSPAPRPPSICGTAAWSSDGTEVGRRCRF
mmetsp:Transcript_88613/g.264309  ORF Transcript_88613/g.264309 Transcript_88613/m.264309 type:complete len:274 (+) Transcript_88613:285-1106(+)